MKTRFTRRRLCVALCAFAAPVYPETFNRSEVRIVGPIDYGQTSAEVRATGQRKFYAFEFNARPGDHVEVSVHARKGSARAYLTDAKLVSLSGGKLQFSATIPVNSEPATYFIVVAADKIPAIFSVELQRPSISKSR